MAKKSDHDEAVGGVARKWERQSIFTVHQNPSQEHNKEYAGEWPDVVVEYRNSGVIYVVCEVETEDSVTEKEAQQWAKYASGDANFHLYVPLGMCDNAKELCDSQDIECEAIHEYSLVAGGSLITEC